MAIGYLVPRVVRHFLPEPLTRLLLRKGLITRPGIETSRPEAAAERYGRVLHGLGQSLQGRRVLVFGYGGSFAIGCALLEAGAGHVVLCDRYAPPDHRRNAALLPRYGAYLARRADAIEVRPEYMTLIQDDIRSLAVRGDLAAVNLVLSSSVYEHLDDVEGCTESLARLTTPGGVHVHFVDLRDHYFKYPFEMLCYSETVWRNWLNPTSHHNRYRLKDYERAFRGCFAHVSITPLTSDSAALARVRHRIRREFLTGDDQIDATTRILIIASREHRLAHAPPGASGSDPNAR